MRARLALSFGLVSALFTAGCGAGRTADLAGGGTGGTPTTGTGGTGATSAGGNGGAGAGTSAGGAGTSNGGTGTGGTSNGGAGGGGGCEAGTEDCNNDAADGCETNLLGDVNNCGVCQVECPPGQGGIPPNCSFGRCGLACEDGKGDCNDDPSDGCEVDLDATDANCGACGLTCMGSPCVQGACACAAETTQANLVQLDLFIMLDQSGSMSEVVQGGGTRWEAVTTALKGFFTDPANADIGVGIQYFPLTPGAACNPFCSTNADCGAFGPCLFFFCAGCAAGGSDSCNAADYAVAEVEIGKLAAAQATALSNSVNAHSPTTNTPTGPALEGAVKHAKTWAMQHPSHNVVVVLATDGQPTECTPQDIPGIANLAAAGVNGSPSVKTFVIGVGPSLDNLNAIAAGGGTGTAFLVDTNANVVQQFKAALDNIQQSALGCEYTIPQPAMGMLDYDKVNVQYTPGNGDPVQVILNVADAAACGPAGGWYYDNNAAPTKIILCGTTCAPVEADAAGSVAVLLGCATAHM